MAGTSQQFEAQTGFTDSGAADGAIKAFRFVESQTTGMSAYEYKAAAVATNAKVVGVAMSDAADGEEVGVCFGGIGIVQVNANTVNIAVGDYIACTGNDGIGGKATQAAQNAITYAHAQALEPANADGQCIRVIIKTVILPGTGQA